MPKISGVLPTLHATLCYRCRKFAILPGQGSAQEGRVITLPLGGYGVFCQKCQENPEVTHEANNPI